MKKTRRLLSCRDMTCALFVALLFPPVEAQIVKFDDAKEIAAAKMGVERVAKGFLPVYTCFASNNSEAKWVQIDLGSVQTVDCIKILPSTMEWGPSSGGFPACYKIEVSSESDFRNPILIEDMSLFSRSSNFTPDNEVAVFDCKTVNCRYVRLTATQLRGNKLCLGRIMVLSGGKDLSVGAKATDSSGGRSQNLNALTAPHRPDGEFVVKDQPENVIPEKQWRPVKNKVETPLTGIKLHDGLLKTVMDNNVDYLLNSFTAADLVRNFKEKAGLPCARLNPSYAFFWMRALPGSEAGRFLMGAGNTLRWQEVKPLRDEMNYIVSVIDSCKEPDGWLMAYQKHEIFSGEYGAYTRSWVTHGLIDAGLGGNKQALPLLRGFYDYMDKSAFLPEMMYRCKQGPQGVIPFTRTYFSPVGKPEDLKVVMRYFQQNFFIERLAKRDPTVIWRYPYDRPHNYLLTAIEPYLDLYRATGAQKYLNAVLGAWDLFHDNWEMPGGEMSINEGPFLYEPKSYWLHKEAGELCGNAFWMKINQRFHNLYPDEEKYVAEIEKSLYNVCIANQYGPEGIRYFAKLDGYKYGPHVAGTHHNMNTCCEGQGTRIYGSIPEHLYSFAPDGIYVDLYGASEVSLPIGRKRFALNVETQFPYADAVKMTVTEGTRAKLHLRIPAWASSDVEIKVNGTAAATGKPGMYQTIDRDWQKGDKIEFTLPRQFKMTPYVGKEPGFGSNNYAIEYGPVLMAAVAVKGEHRSRLIHLDAASLTSHLRPVEGKPLHFTIEGEDQFELWPYFEVQDQPFSCFPEFLKP